MFLHHTELKPVVTIGDLNKFTTKVSVTGTQLPVDDKTNFSCESAKSPGLIEYVVLKLSGFTKFPVTCCIELPAAGCEATIEFYDTVFPALDAAGIEFTLHWGQMNDYQSGGATKVRNRWGDAAVNSWLTARESLLDTQVLRERFSNQMLEDCGLNSTLPPAVIPNVIAGVID